MAFVFVLFLFFFFQAEDGIRDRDVTGVQTCALPIWLVVVGAHGGAQLVTLDKAAYQFVPSVYLNYRAGASPVLDLAADLVLLLLRARNQAQNADRGQRGQSNAAMEQGHKSSFFEIQAPPRWRSASYKHTPLATETFRLSTAPRMGMLTSSSHFFRVNCRMPAPSAPNTKAVGTFRSAW